MVFTRSGDYITLLNGNVIVGNRSDRFRRDFLVFLLTAFLIPICMLPPRKSIILNVKSVLLLFLLLEVFIVYFFSSEILSSKEVNKLFCFTSLLSKFEIQIKSNLTTLQRWLVPLVQSKTAAIRSSSISISTALSSTAST